MSDLITFRVEMRVGQDFRNVEAHFWQQYDGWMIFYRRPPTGGTVECWRVQCCDVVSMETRRLTHLHGTQGKATT